MRKTGCSTGNVFPPEAAAKLRIGERVRQPTPSTRVIEVGFDTKGNPGVEQMLLNTECPNVKTSVVIVDMENSPSEMIEELGEVSQDTQCGQILEGQPHSSPSRTTFRLGKLSDAMRHLSDAMRHR